MCCLLLFTRCCYKAQYISPAALEHGAVALHCMHHLRAGIPSRCTKVERLTGDGLEGAQPYLPFPVPTPSPKSTPSPRLPAHPSLVTALLSGLASQEARDSFFARNLNHTLAQVVDARRRMGWPPQSTVLIGPNAPLPGASHVPPGFSQIWHQSRVFAVSCCDAPTCYQPAFYRLLGRHSRSEPPTRWRLHARVFAAWLHWVMLLLE